MTIYHNHHIIPRHMGGTDDPSNLVRLTVEEHALAHKKLYEEHGRHEDWLAWKGLEGFIGKEEIHAELSRKFLETITQVKIPCKHCGRNISKHNMSRHLYSCTNGKEGTKANPTRKGITLKKWKGTLKTITDGVKDRRIKHYEPVPEGWYLGSYRKGTKYKKH